MTVLTDCHTHRLDAIGALIAVSPHDFDPQPGLRYAVGYHPWHGVEQLTDADYALLEDCARHRQVLAIGETGMDRLRGPSLDIQGRAFVAHLRLAAMLGKPVVVHCVRTAQDILAERRHAGLNGVVMIVHGMRGNQHVARTLLDAGCYLSYGHAFNASAVAITPLDRLLIETDDDDVAISEVAARVGAALGLSPERVTEIASTNLAHCLGAK